ncbi:MAG: Ig-like domain-containing protein [Cytophagales bacterium]|nr:Ig-like domain-containing protein [Armatimonadota bacterium]
MSAPSFGAPAPPGFSNGYVPVVLQAQLRDRNGKPVSGIPLRFAGSLEGFAMLPGGSNTVPCRMTYSVVARTNSEGIASGRVFGPGGAGRAGQAWFRGEASAAVRIAPGSREILLLAAPPKPQTVTLPLLPGFGNPSGESSLHFDLLAFEEADREIGGFPVWTATNGKTDRIVVLLEGFDLYNDYTATNVMQLVSVAGDILRRRGISFLIVNYANSYQSPDQLAPCATEAVRAAARVSGRPVALAGLSMGGLVARWALVEAENAGKPLPVHTLLEMDTPNRGANIHPGLQAMIARYGVRSDREGIQSAAARALLFARPTAVEWRRIGLPLADRHVPIRWTDNSADHDDFYRRLRALNAKGGYPTTIRRVAVANSSRVLKAPGSGSLLHLWLPWGFAWTLAARPADRAPGSLLPPQYGRRFASYYPFGIAGSYLGAQPTFVPASSALDAEANERPPFDAFYARPDNQPNRPHDDIDPGAAAFVVREILSENWQP